MSNHVICTNAQQLGQAVDRYMHRQGLASCLSDQADTACDPCAECEQELEWYRDMQRDTDRDYRQVLRQWRSEELDFHEALDLLARIQAGGFALKEHADRAGRIYQVSSRELAQVYLEGYHGLCLWQWQEDIGVQYYKPAGHRF